MSAAESGLFAYRAARRLHVVSTVILVVVTAATAVGAAVGVALAIVSTTDRTAGIVLAVALVGDWLAVALACFAGQAAARYIEHRVESSGAVEIVRR